MLCHSNSEKIIGAMRASIAAQLTNPNAEIIMPDECILSI